MCVFGWYNKSALRLRIQVWPPANMSEGVPARPRALEMIAAARQQPLSGAQGYFAVRFGQIMNFRVAAAEMSSRAGMKMIYTFEFIHLTDIHRIIHFFLLFRVCANQRPLSRCSCSPKESNYHLVFCSTRVSECQRARWRQKLIPVQLCSWGERGDVGWNWSFQTRNALKRAYLYDWMCNIFSRCPLHIFHSIELFKKKAIFFNFLTG